MLGLMAYTAKKSRDRDGGTFFHQFGPLIVVMISVPMVLADPTRHVLQDANLWLPPSSSEYRSDCHDETIRCLSVVGVLFTIVMTYFGFALLIYGTLWNANFGQAARHSRQVARATLRREVVKLTTASLNELPRVLGGMPMNIHLSLHDVCGCAKP